LPEEEVEVLPEGLRVPAVLVEEAPVEVTQMAILPQPIQVAAEEVQLVQADLVAEATAARV